LAGESKICIGRNMEITEKVNCTICGSKSKELFMLVESTHGRKHVSNEKFSLMKCSDCGLIYLSPRPTEEFIWRYYDGIDYYNNRPTIRNIAGSIISDFSVNFKKNLILNYKNNGWLLDIGYGDGRFMKAMRDTNFLVHGIERTENLSAIKDNSQAIITLWHVFEHLHNPNLYLLEIYRILSTTGYLFLEMPNIESAGAKFWKDKWFHMDAPRHLYHYSPDTIKRILNLHNFDIVNMKKTFDEMLITARKK